jgi:hypothetical protein
MLGVARTGDTVSGVCSAPGHTTNRAFTGVWTSTHTTIQSEGKGIILVGDTGSTDCGHTFRATTGSSLVSNNSTRLHRVTDNINIVEGPGSGTTTTGSTVVQCA